MSIPDGFPGQKLIVLPRPLVTASLTRPGTAHLVVTDCGYFPQARAHGRARPEGVDQAIVMVCAKGRGWAELNGQRHLVRPGEVLVIPPSTAHSYGADPDDPWTLWWVHVTGPDLAELLRSSRLTAQSPVREVGDPFRVMALMAEIVRTLERDTTDRNLLMASGAAWHLLAVLSAGSHAPGTSSAVDNAREYLRDHFVDQVSVSELAAMASMSASHFAASFRARFGVSVLRYQTELRMAQARQLLDMTDLPIATIAEQVGYPDPFYFSRKFTSIHGTPPRQYRAEKKG